MQKVYVHPLPIRIWQWINAIGFVVMLITGVQIRYVGQIDLMSFRNAVNLHNWIGFVLIGNFFIWFLFYLFSDKIKVYHPELSPSKQFRASVRQLAYYGYGIFKGDPNPHHISAYHKFNPLQSMSYQIVMLLLIPVHFFTGVLLRGRATLCRSSGISGRGARGGYDACSNLYHLRRVYFHSSLPRHSWPYTNSAYQGNVHWI